MYKLPLLLLSFFCFFFETDLQGQKHFIKDIDENQYEIVKIGEQWWMAENLRTASFKNGEAINHITSAEEWSLDSTGAWCFFDNDTAKQNTFGNLYNWHAVKDERGICPLGWHVPTDREWIELEQFLGMSSRETEKMTAWRGASEGDLLKSEEFGGNNSTGFSAKGTGYRHPNGEFRGLGTDNDYWTSTGYMNKGEEEGLLHGLLNSKSTIVRNFHVPEFGFCIRCVKDRPVDDTLLVQPGPGSLNTAISEFKTDVIYKLSAGKKYSLNSIIELSRRTLGDTGKPLIIIGEKTNSMPAIIQVGTSPDGNVFPQLFRLYSDLVIKNVFISGQDIHGNSANQIFSLEAKVKLVVDNCIIDPAGLNRTFAGVDKADLSVFYLTNSQIYRNGHMQSPNDGGWLGSMAWDTLWVENNTLVSSGQDFIGTPFHNQPNNQFIWINHNTFLWHDVWIKKSYNDQNFYFTNNLMHDISLFPELPLWYKFFPDFESGNTLLAQVAIDTLVIQGETETLPSERVAFWLYNMMYYSPEIQALPKYAADNEIELAYLIPLVWDEDVPLSYTGGIDPGPFSSLCRENKILSDDVNWPLMKYGNNLYDIDPEYEDTMIYCVNDSAGEHLLGFYRGQFWDESDAPGINELPSYNWDIDGWNEVLPSEYPKIWPRFNGKYQNEQLLTASIENLPLGDLNWFPEKKLIWEANKDKIQNHILELNENRIQLFPLSEKEKISEPFPEIRIYPNPAKTFISIRTGDSEDGYIEFINLSGKLCFSGKLQSNLSRIDISQLENAVYIVKVHFGEKESYHKIIKL